MEKTFWQHKIRVQNHALLFVLIMIAAFVTALATRLNTGGAIAAGAMAVLCVLIFIYAVIRGKYNRVLLDKSGFTIFYAGLFAKVYDWDMVEHCEVTEKTATPRTFTYYKLTMKSVNDAKEQTILIERNDDPQGFVENYISVEGIKPKPVIKSSIDIFDYTKRLWQAIKAILILNAAFVVGTISLMLRRNFYFDIVHLLTVGGISSGVMLLLFVLFALFMRSLKLNVTASGIAVVLPRESLHISWSDIDEVREYSHTWGKTTRQLIHFKLKDSCDAPYSGIYTDKTDKLLKKLATYYDGVVL